MWLLSTATIELEYFNGPDDQRLADDGGYAILSHVWQQGKEQSFQDIRSLQSQGSNSPSDAPRSRVSLKIRDCCILAERYGYRWVWIDTCCIDKTSSAELSEAINSMYAWYAQAAVCYAYLGDVDSDHIERGSQFYRSRWFTRGWTLQELIAPTSLLFFSSNWTILGTRTDLVQHVESITGVDAEVLLFQCKLEAVSIARRMSWACGRQTTRVEDEAYSLMGIFGVNMPTIYGEGRAAFIRLQEEIMKVCPDQTIFAWGDHISSHEFAEITIKAVDEIPVQLKNQALLASSPQAFHTVKTPYPYYQPEPITIMNAILLLEKKGWRLGNPDTEPTSDDGEDSSKEPRASEFTITSHGMRSTLPIIWVKDYDLCVAVLGCRDTLTGEVMGMLLGSRAHQESAEYQGDHKLYFSNLDLERKVSLGPVPHRLVLLGGPGDLYEYLIKAESTTDRSDSVPAAASQASTYSSRGAIIWHTIHITNRPSLRPYNAARDMLLSQMRQNDDIIYTLSRWSASELKQWGFQFTGWTRVGSAGEYWMAVFRSNFFREEVFTIILGDCFCVCNEDKGQSKAHNQPDTFLRQTAILSFTTPTSFTASISSAPDLERSDARVADVEAVMASADCSLSHIEERNNGMVELGNGDRAVQLTYRATQGTYVPGQASTARVRQHFLEIDIRLSGSVYVSLRDMLRKWTCVLQELKQSLPFVTVSREDACRYTRAVQYTGIIHDDNAPSGTSNDSDEGGSLLMPGAWKPDFR